MTQSACSAKRNRQRHCWLGDILIDIEWCSWSLQSTPSKFKTLVYLWLTLSREKIATRVVLRCVKVANIQLNLVCKSIYVNNMLRMIICKQPWVYSLFWNKLCDKDLHILTYIRTLSVLFSGLLITSSYLKKTVHKKIRHWHCRLFLCHLFSQLNNLLLLTLRCTEFFDQYSCVSEYTPALYRCRVSKPPLSI